MNARFRAPAHRPPGAAARHLVPAEQRWPQEAYTLNGTAVTARSLIAILENVQDEDRSVAVPPMLERYGAPSRVGAAG